MPFFIGLDGGKSKTDCLLADADGHILGRGSGGNSDKYSVPLEQALQVVEDCVRQALAQAGLQAGQVECACFGLAGADWPEDFRQLEELLSQRRLARRVLVKNDANLSLRAAIPQGPGVALSAGTHLAAALRTPAGEEWHSGWFSVDGAGGAHLGQRAFWAVMHAEDGRGPATALTGLVLQVAGAGDPLELLRRLSRGELDEAFFASLAPLVFQAHLEHADRAAAELIESAGLDMSRWAVGLLRRGGLLAQPAPVALCGGLFRNPDPLLREVVSAAVHHQAPHAQIFLAQRPPAAGALLYALESGGLPLTPQRLAALDASLPPMQ